MILRDATPDDITALAALGAATFAGTFAKLYAPEDLAAFLDEFHSEDYYRKALADPSIALHVMEVEGKLVAYNKLGPNSLPCDPPSPGALELSRIYVLANYRGQSIGDKLMQNIITYAQNHDHPEIVLSVYAKNFAGHRFYERYGFVKTDEYKFKVGNHYDPEWIMTKILKIRAL